MKIVTLSSLVLAFMFIFAVSTPVSAVYDQQNTQLTDGQIQAVVDLLESFNVESVVIDKVRVTLGSKKSTVSAKVSNGCGYIGKINQKIARGTSGEGVSALQNFLKEQGTFTYPKATGYFGPITQEALNAWQLKYGISESGAIGSKTLAKMGYLCQVKEQIKQKEQKEVVINAMAAISSISDAENPVVEGTAENTDIVDLMVYHNGSKIYYVTGIEVEDEQWSHTISTDLDDGTYEIKVLVKGSILDRKTIER